MSKSLSVILRNFLSCPPTPKEDIAYFTNVVFSEDEVYLAIEPFTERLVGFITFNRIWLNHLYILPDSQGLGLGKALIAFTKENTNSLDLWTFQKNLKALSFYKNSGFVEIKKTDGAENEEKEPDVLLRWNKS